MKRAWTAALSVALCLAVAACVLPGGGAKTGAADGTEAISAGPDSPRPKARPGSETAVAPTPPATAAASALEPPTAARTPDAQDDMLRQAAEAETAPAAEATPAPELPKDIYTAPEPPPIPAALTGQAAQCTKKKGRFIRRGEGGAFACVLPTRDANKRCDDGADCQGICFAKSRTCAPVTPLFGCYDALENGRVVNICTE